uniref:DNA polymerase II subunit 2 n=1 Tax=Oryza meridionalis TaxID=40149 RepID=A0A0E0EMA6_9ORYZ
MAAPSAATRKNLQRKFRLRGFTLKVDALEEAAAFLARFPDAEEDALDLLLDELDKEPLQSSILDRGVVRRVVALLVEAEEAVDAASPAATSARSALRVVDSFLVPRFHYDPIKKVFYEYDREASLSMLMGLDFFGGGVIAAEETVRLSTLEKKAMNDMFVILSDIWLDSSEFGKLGEMIAARSRLKEHSRFLFIPGPEDAGPSKALPRCTLPKYLTEELQKHIPNAIFVSNPCRVKFYTQEIVFFRQDLLYRMRRSCLIPPTTEETSDPFEHLVATITHQSHLCPLPLTVQPIIWNYDHCLRLYPTPHTIVLGDKSEQKAFKYTGITCFNPGSFGNDSSFAAYRPCTKELEVSIGNGVV